MNYANPSPEKQWHHFPMWEPRPTDLRVHNESERKNLERAVAVHVGTLLSYYGNIEPIDVDSFTNPDIDPPAYYDKDADDDTEVCRETRKYVMLALEPIPLEDEGELIIGQLPFDGRLFIVEPGAHAVTKTTMDAFLECEYTIWDQTIETDQHVHTADGRPIPIDFLQELFEALVVTLRNYAQYKQANDPPLDAGAYPIQVIDPEFLAIISEEFAD